jgi:hypothetical protein
MEQAISLLSEARLRFRNVRDYVCKMISRERVNGVLLPLSTMSLKVRNVPFSVYLRCESPEADRGMEVCYVTGRNNGMMRVHSAGPLGLLGFMSIDPRDSRALEKSRHPITEAGMGQLLENTARYWEMERRLNRTQVWITQGQMAGRSCIQIETVHPDRNAGSFYGYRSLLWLDRATYLPIGAETYDWPRPGGPVDGDLLESCRFLDVRCNIGLGDDIFSH